MVKDGMVWCGVWYSVVCGVVWYCMVKGGAWCVMVWYGMVWYGTVWYGYQILLVAGHHHPGLGQWASQPLVRLLPVSYKASNPLLVARPSTLLVHYLYTTSSVHY